MTDIPILPQQLLSPQKLYSRTEILTRPSPVPKEAGIYAWYIRNLPEIVPTADCHYHTNLPLVYIGISVNLKKRLRQHFNGPTNLSTFRRTLSSLLVDNLALTPQMINKKKFNLGQSEENLNQWIAQNGSIVWMAHPTPRQLELAFLKSDLSLPLNVESNKSHPFQKTLKQLRLTLKART